MSRSRWIHWSLLAVPLFFVGCNKSENIGTIPVTGLVTLDGQPVAGAAVSFSPYLEDRPGRRGDDRCLGPIQADHQEAR